ncbi:NADH-quinone oxidoreductase subunit NuoH [Candidatus Poribacteria bacterium]|nr:NADH-quinone oxidoreductase subunit NuoH [Candidatus Poribacteria bacterium]
MRDMELIAEGVRTGLAKATQTLGLGGEWPLALPLNAVVAAMYIALAAVSVGIVAAVPIILVLAERKVSAYFQDRLGPMRVGPWGLLVTLADGVKLLFKEDIIPPQGDRTLFRLAPYVVFASSFAAVVALPVFPSAILGNVSIGIFYIMAISSLGALGIMMAGWASNSKWSLFGAMRAAAQIVSYEIPLGLSILMIVMTTGTLNMQEIVQGQSDGIGDWLVFRHPFLFGAGLIYFISSIAEVNRTPFDLPEAESELVAGFHTEYSGIRFAYFFLAEYANMFIVTAILTTLFFGGWSSPLGGEALLPGAVWFIAKAAVIIFVMMWIRWTLPRVRVDQLMNLCWKYFLPISFVNILGTGVLLLLEGEGIGLKLGEAFIGVGAVSWVVVPVALVVTGLAAFSGGDAKPRAVRPLTPSSS